MAIPLPHVMTEAEYLELTGAYVGICLECGTERECTEPDAENYDCPGCKARRVFGVEQMLICGMVEFSEVIDR